MAPQTVDTRKNEAKDVPSQAFRREMALLEALQLGQVQRAQRFLDAGNVDVDFEDDHGCSALHFAAKKGDMAFVNMLLGAGCDMDACSKTYGTALCLAASMSHVEVVKALVEAGADVKAPGGGFGSALHAACRAGSMELVDLFLQHGIAPDVVCTTDVSIVREGKHLQFTPTPKAQNYNYCEQQPIHVAARYGSVELVSKLLDLGMDVNACSRAWESEHPLGTYDTASEKHRMEGTTVLHIACDRGREDLVGILLGRGADPNAQPSNRIRGPPLCSAVNGGNLKCVSLLLDAGASVHQCTAEGWTALFVAVRVGNHQGARLLLDRGAQVDSRLATGITPIFCVNDPEMVELLVQRGAAIDDEVRNSLTALKYVAGMKQDGAKALVKLVELGACVDYVGGKSTTALGFAVTKKNRDNAVALLRCGADPKKVPSGLRKELEALVGDELTVAKRVASQKRIPRSDGLLKRLLHGRKPQSSESESHANSQNLKDNDDDDEKTLCGE